MQKDAISEITQTCASKSEVRLSGWEEETRKSWPSKRNQSFQIMITRKEKEENGFAVCRLHNSLDGRD
jgi:hypothetical protein